VVFNTGVSLNFKKKSPSAQCVGYSVIFVAYSKIFVRQNGPPPDLWNSDRDSVMV